MDTEHFKERRKGRLKHQIVWVSLVILYFKVIFDLVFWGYQQLPIGDSWGMGVEFVINLALIGVSLLIAVILTHLLVGPLELKHL